MRIADSPNENVKAGKETGSWPAPVCKEIILPHVSRFEVEIRTPNMHEGQR